MPTTYYNTRTYIYLVVPCVEQIQFALGHIVLDLLEMVLLFLHLVLQLADGVLGLAQLVLVLLRVHQTAFQLAILGLEISVA